MNAEMITWTLIAVLLGVLTTLAVGYLWRR